MRKKKDKDGKNRKNKTILYQREFLIITKKYNTFLSDLI